MRNIWILLTRCHQSICSWWTLFGRATKTETGFSRRRLLWEREADFRILRPMTRFLPSLISLVFLSIWNTYM